MGAWRPYQFWWGRGAPLSLRYMLCLLQLDCVELFTIGTDKKQQKEANAYPPPPPPPPPLPSSITRTAHHIHHIRLQQQVEALNVDCTLQPGSAIVSNVSTTHDIATLKIAHNQLSTTHEIGRYCSLDW